MANFSFVAVSDAYANDKQNNFHIQLRQPIHVSKKTVMKINEVVTPQSMSGSNLIYINCDCVEGGLLYVTAIPPSKTKLAHILTSEDSGKGIVTPSRLSIIRFIILNDSKQPMLFQEGPVSLQITVGESI